MIFNCVVTELARFAKIIRQPLSITRRRILARPRERALLPRNLHLNCNYYADSVNIPLRGSQGLPLKFDFSWSNARVCIKTRVIITNVIVDNNVRHEKEVETREVTSPA